MSVGVMKDQKKKQTTLLDERVASVMGESENVKRRLFSK